MLWFPAPHSATGEDVAELQVHGSRAVIAMLAAVLTRLGLRLAEPGEFTRRAFLNGKLDLLQAEAAQHLRDRRQHGAAAVHMQLGDILAGRALRPRKPQHQPVVELLSGGRINEVSALRDTRLWELAGNP